MDFLPYASGITLRHLWVQVGHTTGRKVTLPGSLLIRDVRPDRRNESCPAPNCSTSFILIIFPLTKIPTLFLSSLDRWLKDIMWVMLEFGDLTFTILVSTGQAPLFRRTQVPFQSLLDESLIYPWLPKMTLPWKQLLLLSIIDCLTGKPPFCLTDGALCVRACACVFTFGHLQLQNETKIVSERMMAQVYRSTLQYWLPLTIQTQYSQSPSSLCCDCNFMARRSPFSWNSFLWHLAQNLSSGKREQKFSASAEDDFVLIIVATAFVFTKNKRKAILSVCLTFSTVC